MKKNIYIQYLSRAVMALAVVGAMTSCAEDAGLFDIFPGGDGTGLSVAPVVSEPTVVTRAETPSVTALNEEQLNTLDVFVEAVDNPGTFMKQYHLVAPTNEIGHQVQSLLADNWRAEGLEVGKKYNVYVATNNTQTKDVKDLSTFDVAALKNLVADEVTDGLALIEEGTGNIAAPWSGDFADTPSGNIYKQYIPADQIDNVRTGRYNSIYGYTAEKEFMMDGIIKNWTPDANTRDQVFGAESNVLTLNRAAAKIVLNLKFDADFLKSLTHNKKVEGETITWEEKPAAEKVTITGAPAWRFYNFAFGAPVFAPETQGEGVEVHNSSTILYHPYDFEGEDKHAQIITYTYPNKWDAADYATKAPSLVISVGFTENGATNYHYYRIPIVKSDVTKIERNHIYVVNATIATRGSELHEDEDLIEDVVYNVLPWNDENNSAAIHNEVDVVQHLYLKVNPKVYTLRGDGDQSVVINYLKAAGTEVGWKLFTINTTTEEKGEAVESTASNAVWGWFYDKNGNMKTTYSNWNHMRVNIVQSSEGTNDSKGTVTVTSTALDNRAIKYMLLRVYLKDSPTLYEDVLIRHFPTDNIQSFTGKWSSYHTGVSSREDTWDPVASGWEEGTYASEEVEVSASGPYDRVGTKYVVSTTNRNTFRAAVPASARGTVYDSQENSYHATDGYDYWGTPTSNNDFETYRSNNDRSANYDYWIYGLGNYRYYFYYNYTGYSRGHEETAYYRTRYYRMTTVETPETGNWVDWDRDAGHSGTAKTVSSGGFHAHVWDENRGRVREINSNNNNMASMGNNTGDHYNNHMYVVQISSTSDKYVLGKPILGNPDANRSLDEVVSPAFMIASQLGVVSSGSYTSATAAQHCRRYMEVGTDGYRYAGWRLPTNDEIKIISDYQMGRFGSINIPEDDRVMDYVLKGANYFNLSGGTTPSNYTTGNDTFLRCVRDLTAKEIEDLNGFDKLIEKYQAK